MKDKVAETMAEFETERRRSCSGQRVFLTTGHQLGLGPIATEAGDIVAILWGCIVPVILRPLKLRGECLVVGPAYVCGMMEGEVVEWLEAQGRLENSSMTFYLR